MLDGAIVRQPDATPCCVLYVAHAVPEVVSVQGVPSRPGESTGDTRPSSTTSAARSRSSGIGETAYTKASGRTAREIGAEAAERAIADAGLEPADIDGLTWSGAFADFDVAVFHEHFGTTHDMWTSPWGGGMAWAATAPYLAAQAIRDGQGPPRAQRVPRRVGDAARLDDRRPGRGARRAVARSRTSKCRSAGSRSPCTSRRSCAGTCSSSARPRSSSARSRSRAGATPTCIPAR